VFNCTDAFQQGFKGITVGIVREHGVSKGLDPDTNLQQVIQKACLKINLSQADGKFLAGFLGQREEKEKPGDKIPRVFFMFRQ